MKRAFFVPFILSEGNFFYSVLNNFQNIHTFTYQKILPHTFFNFSSEFCEIFKNAYFYKTSAVAIFALTHGLT